MRTLCSNSACSSVLQSEVLIVVIWSGLSVPSSPHKASISDVFNQYSNVCFNHLIPSYKRVYQIKGLHDLGTGEHFLMQICAREFIIAPHEQNTLVLFYLFSVSNHIKLCNSRLFKHLWQKNVPSKEQKVYVPPMKRESLTIFEFIGILTKSASWQFRIERFER